MAQQGPNSLPVFRPKPDLRLRAYWLKKWLGSHEKEAFNTTASIENKDSSQFFLKGSKAIYLSTHTSGKVTARSFKNFAKG